MRVPVLLIIGFACLGLFCGDSPARPLWLPTVDNPYCDVATYLFPDLPEQAISTMDNDHNPVIVVSAMTMRETLPYAHFLMAHECCHHTLGHVKATQAQLGQLGPQPFFYIAPALKQMELDADCCAVKMLKARNEPESIEAARETMAKFGDKPTGAYYPTGVERANHIAECASQN